MPPFLSISRRTRRTPFTDRVTAEGVTAYTIYNRMLLPTVFRSVVEDYHHLKTAVQVWDVACERQVEIRGTPGRAEAVQDADPPPLSRRHGRSGNDALYAMVDETAARCFNDPGHGESGRGPLLGVDRRRRPFALAEGVALGFRMAGGTVDSSRNVSAAWRSRGPRGRDLAAGVFAQRKWERGVYFFFFCPGAFGDSPWFFSRTCWLALHGVETGFF